MATYRIYLDNLMDDTTYFEVEGTEAAYAAYEHAAALAEMTTSHAQLVDWETGEILADTWADEDEGDGEPSYDLDCGFDPYAGCYTDDC